MKEVLETLHGISAVIVLGLSIFYYYYATPYICRCWKENNLRNFIKTCFHILACIIFVIGLFSHDIITIFGLK